MSGINRESAPQAVLKTKFKVYIAGPMTGLPDLNFPTFNLAAALLRLHGFKVVNPAEFGFGPDTPWQACMRVGIAQLTSCDAICLLKGWEKSKGATLEVMVAKELGIEIVEPT